MTAPLVVLVGPPGAGKSTVARALASRLGVGVRDTDADVEAAAGKPISDVFVEDGEAHFRALEHDAVARALAEHEGVLALGGGAVLDPRTEQALTAYTDAGGHVVFLDVSLAKAAPRVGFSTARPLLLGNPRAQWQALMEVRRPIYTRVCTLRVLTDDVRPAQVAERIADHVLTAVLGARGGADGPRGSGGPTDAHGPGGPGGPSDETTESSS